MLCGANQGSNQTNLSTAVLQMYSQDPNVQGFDAQNQTIQSTVSIAPLIGSIIGALLTTYFIVKFKRKYVMITACGLSIAFNSLIFIPWCWEYLFVAKILAGIPAGMISTIAPGWLAELCSIQQRGLITVLNEPSVCLGYMLNSLMLLIIGENSCYWRLSFLPIITVCFFELICSSLLDEKSQKRIKENSSEEISSQPKNDQPVTWSQFFTKKHYKSVWISILLPFAMQATGKSAIVAYSTKIFQNIFVNVPQIYSSIYGSLITSSCGLAFSMCSLIFINRLGRKPLLFGGFSICHVGLVIYIICYAIDNSQPNQVILIIACFAFFIGYENGPGPVFYAITGEIYPFIVKSKASGVTFCVKNAVNLVANLIFPYFQNYYWALYSIFLVFSITPTWVMFPIVIETKGKKLGEIQEQMIQNDYEKLEENIAVMQDVDYK